MWDRFQLKEEKKTIMNPRVYSGVVLTYICTSPEDEHTQTIYIYLLLNIDRMFYLYILK
jgi:hypothetical protein